MSQITTSVLLLGGIFLYIGLQTYLICCCNNPNNNNNNKGTVNESLLEV